MQNAFAPKQAYSCETLINKKLSDRCYFTSQDPTTKMRFMLGLRMGQQQKKIKAPNEL